MRMLFHQRPGRRVADAARRLPLLAAAFLLAGCNYGFQGGGGFPSHIRSIFIETFEQDTGPFELPTELYNAMMEQVPRALGIRPAGREVADAILVGRIRGYEDVAGAYRPDQTARAGVQVAQNRVQIRVEVMLIDTRRNLVLWENRGLSAQGEYIQDTQQDRDGRRRAIEHLIQQVLDGAQSQW
jgi:hypothetical protein